LGYIQLLLLRIPTLVLPAVLYPFGHGLSYTSFTYAGLALPTTVEPCSGFNLSVTVHNNGNIGAFEPIQVYLAWPDLSSAPVLQLAGLQRVWVPAWAARTVQLHVRSKELVTVQDLV
jgi:beta-glucosidase